MPKAKTKPKAKPKANPKAKPKSKPKAKTEDEAEGEDEVGSTKPPRGGDISASDINGKNPSDAPRHRRCEPALPKAAPAVRL